MKIAPSLLAADFSRLGEELERVCQADLLHIDVMDGHFVPNLSIGPGVIAALRPHSKLFFDVHLMVEHPLAWIDRMRKAGADGISFHAECADDAGETIAFIKKTGAKCGMAISPETDPQVLAPFGKDLDRVIVMTVHPGFGGQEMLRQVLGKLPKLRQLCPIAQLEIDGGVNLKTAPLCRQADVLVAGTAVFSAQRPGDAIQALKAAAKGGESPQK